MFLGWIIASQGPQHLSGAVVSHQDSRGTSRHGDERQLAQAHKLPPDPCPGHPSKPEDDSPGRQLLGKGSAELRFKEVPWEIG